MKEFRADLHLHTTCSDGSLSPKELVDLAVSKGLQGIAITDHDTISAYDSIFPYAKEKGLLIGTGVEFSCFLNKMSCHILGYDFDPTSPQLREYCRAHQGRRAVRNGLILDKLEKKGVKIDREKFAQMSQSYGTIGRPHIAALLMEGGYVGSMREAFDQYLGEGASCFAAGPQFSAEEGIEQIRAAGGKAFIAHPHLIESRSLVRELLLLPFDGIECYYGNMPKRREFKWLQLAAMKNLLISGGSDYHGDAKPYLEIGCSWVDRLVFDQIFENLKTYANFTLD